MKKINTTDYMEFTFPLGDNKQGKYIECRIIINVLKKTKKSHWWEGKVCYFKEGHKLKFMEKAIFEQEKK